MKVFSVENSEAAREKIESEGCMGFSPYMRRDPENPKRWVAGVEAVNINTETQARAVSAMMISTLLASMKNRGITPHSVIQIDDGHGIVEFRDDVKPTDNIG